VEHSATETMLTDTSKPTSSRGDGEQFMGRGPRYRVVFRRRREKRTDFRMRKAMILSKMPRLVVRSSLRHVQLQVEEALPIGDKTVASANSSELGSYGWKAATGNIPAAYLTGYLLGKRAAALGMGSMILDIGLSRKR